MIRYLIVILLLFSFFNLGWTQIDEREIKVVAKDFLLKAGQEAGLKNEVRKISRSDTILAYVTELEPLGFIVLTPSKLLSPILAFSFENDFDFLRDTDNSLLYLIEDDMTHQLKLIDEAESTSLFEFFQGNIIKWEQGQSSSRAFEQLHGPLLSDLWGQVNCKDQDSSYIYVTNYYTPNHYAAGCVAISAAQIMHYYNWPIHGQGAHTNYDNSGNSQGSYSAIFDTSYYDWWNMLDEYMYKSSSLDERKAVGLLAYHSSIAYDMDYEYDGSTASISDSPDVLANYFRTSCHYKTTSWSSFWDRFDENLENGHPLQLDIRGSGSIGHAPVCDGYGVLDENPDIDERYYHLNMGWWGSTNAWYRLRGTFNAGGYTSVNAAIFDILPIPEFVPMDVQSQKEFTLQWETANNLTCDSFQLQKYLSDTWSTIAIISGQSYVDTVSSCGNYQYRVRAKTDGHWYADSYSESLTVFVSGDITSLEFDGNDSYFVNEQDDRLDVVGENWTIEAWVYPTEIPESGVFPAILSRKYSFEMYFRNSSDELGIGILALDGSDSGFVYEASLNSGSNTMSLNEWHHIAASWDGSSTRLFIDGEVVGTSTDTDFDLDASIASLNIGARYDSGNGGYLRYIQNCRLDAIRISETARYTTTFSPKHSEPYVPDAFDVLIFQLDEGTGVALTDATGFFCEVSLRSDPHDAAWSCDPSYRGFYVDNVLGDDANPGTVNAPWQSIAKINASSFEPGDHIYLKRNGSWNETLELNQKSGSAYAPIIIEPYGSGNNPILNQSDQGVIIDGSSFVTIQKVDIQSDTGIVIKDGSGSNAPEGIVIQNNSIHDEIDNEHSGEGIFLTHGITLSSIKGNTISDHSTGIWIGEMDGIQPGNSNLIHNNEIYQNDQNGISVIKSDCTSGNESIVSSNSVYENGFHGIQLSGRYYIVSQNLVYNNGQDLQGGACGILLHSRAAYEDGSYDQGGDHNIIKNNSIFGTLDRTGLRSAGDGIKIGGWCNDNLVYNNLVYNNDGSGLFLEGASQNQIFNNSFYGNGQDLGNRIAQFECSVIGLQLSGVNGNGVLPAQENEVKNNIGMAVGDETSRYAVAIGDLSMSEDNLFQNNIWYNDSGSRNTGISSLSSQTVMEKTIDEWNTFTWTSAELSLDPMFVDPSNADMNTEHDSPAVDIGQDLSALGLDTDFYGKQRPLLNNFDIGAIEHGYFWTGKMSSDWDNKKNWFNNEIPAENSCVTIVETATHMPIIHNDVVLRKFFLQANTQLKLMQGKWLSLEE